ncbi:hypothetical protein CC86DRAFT_319841 [Ophiobolus disseminans]|uniref:Uncharacterized protein n=1 Tax=Ophiobolus disseminans TaxID=1469910 RepID=A0A6A7A6J2_9PLEO|nr:hypothetical protein CC86DRAFT_319841 [Ophiobolus disseminans]
MQPPSSPVSPIQYSAVTDREFSRSPEIEHDSITPAKTQARAIVVTEQKRDGSDDGSGRYDSKPARPHFIWWYETTCCFLAVGALVGTVAMVWSFDHRPLPHWPYELSINTFIAAFSVLLKTSAGLVLAESISHIKWTELKQPRSLRSFTVHDDASRGPWGAFALLWNDKGRHISSLGALIIILILFMEPFTQQIVSFYDCVEVDRLETGKIPRTNFYVQETGFNMGGASNVPWALRNSINQGLFATNKPQLDISCDSGNCTFSGTYSSLAFCSVCKDISSELVSEPWPNPRNITPVPNQFRYPNMTLRIRPGAQSNLSLALPAGEGMVEETRRTLVAQGFPMIDVIRSLDNKNYVAHSCNVSACMQTYEAMVRSSKLEETVVDEHLIPRSTEFGYYRVADLECIQESKKQQLSEMGYNLEANPRWLPYNVSVFYNVTEERNTFQGSCQYVPADKVDKFCDKNKRKIANKYLSLSDDAAQIVPADCVYSMSDTAGNTLYTSVFRDLFKGELLERGTSNPPALFGPEPLMAIRHAGSGNGTLKDMSDLMRNISNSLTTYVRQHGNVNMSNPMLGTVTRNTVCIRVQWPWVAFSAAIVLLTLVFFLYVVVKARGDQAELRRAWETEGVHAPFYDFKSSALALLFHGLDDDSRRQLIDVGSTNRTAEMAKRSKDVKIQLVATERGWKLATVGTHNGLS